MKYVLVCEDREGGLEVRLANREKHLAFLGELGARVSLAGPMLSDDGELMVGSVLIIEAESVEEIRQIADSDPYALAGLFKKVTIRPFRQVIPGP
jgi:uncharacterized protein YciI